MEAGIHVYCTQATTNQALFKLDQTGYDSYARIDLVSIHHS